MGGCTAAPRAKNPAAAVGLVVADLLILGGRRAVASSIPRTLPEDVAPAFRSAGFGSRASGVGHIEVVLDRLAYGWSPEEIHFQHTHLSLAQIHAALAYYCDHQATLDGEIAREEQQASELRRQPTESPLRDRLKARGLLS